MTRGKKEQLLIESKKRGYRYLGLNDILGKLERCSLPDVVKKSVGKNGGQRFQRVAKQADA